LRGFGIALALALTGCPKETPAPIDSGADTGPPPLNGIAYATRTVDLHYDSMGGPVVGHAYAGARVRVTPYKTEYVRVHIGREWLHDKDDGVILYADKTAFAREEQPRAPIPFAPSMHDVPSLDIRPAADNSSTFAATICGDIRILTPPGIVPAQVSQLHDGIEVSGWADKQPQRGDRCNVRRVEREGNELRLKGGLTKADNQKIDSVPPGFVTASAGPDALAPLLRSGKSIWWLVFGNENAQCYEWKFVANTDDGSMAQVTPIQHGIAKPVWPSFDLAYVTKPTLLLIGNETTESLAKNPKAARENRCGGSLYYVGTSDGAIRMSSIDPRSAVAWNPDDEDRWFTKKEACAAARPPPIPPGSLHWACFGGDSPAL
jgi:hypothetical protein